MTPEERTRAEEVAAMSTDIKQLVCSYNCHKRSAADYRDPNSMWRDIVKYPAWGPEKADSSAEWHEYIFHLVNTELEKRWVFVSLTNFFDDTEFEHPEAPGLIIKKLKAEKEFEIVKDPYDMEEDLTKSDLVKQKVLDDVFAQQLYAALCNVSWLKNGVEWGCSWRYAGGIVADLRNKNEDYMDYYCSGIGNGASIPEGHVSQDVRDTLATLNWIPDPKDVAHNLGLPYP